MDEISFFYYVCLSSEISLIFIKCQLSKVINHQLIFFIDAITFVVNDLIPNEFFSINLTNFYYQNLCYYLANSFKGLNEVLLLKYNGKKSFI